ncbi:MAG: N-acetylmuramoyl-L-alanine amidase [Alphaproteobacteria bacterium]|nr:N-acetylmuramoyl-L-alanine amidase [Alphaproteobacteria bacterium]
MIDFVDTPSPNHNARRSDRIDILLLHYTVFDGPRSLTALTDRERKVSAHYLVMEDARVHRLVDEDRRAWHAGVSFWDGETDINSRSIGIEIVNQGNETGQFQPYAPAQIDAVIALSQEILARHPIPPERVLGHSDVAPDRKIDPGDLFPWQRLAAEGVGLWPDAPVADAPKDPAWLRTALGRYGYDPKADTLISAFQRHFRADRVDGVADPETAGLALRLLQLVGRADIDAGV